MVEVHLLDGPGYRTHGIYNDQETLVSATFPDLAIDLSQVFPRQDIDEIRESAPPYAVEEA